MVYEKPMAIFDFMKCGSFIFSVLPVRVLYNITLFCVRVADFYGEKVQFEKKRMGTISKEAIAELERAAELILVSYFENLIAHHHIKNFSLKMPIFGDTLAVEWLFPSVLRVNNTRKKKESK